MFIYQYTENNELGEELSWSFRLTNEFGKIIKENQLTSWNVGLSSNFILRLK